MCEDSSGWVKVVLIGGAPVSGKTSVARALAARMRYCCLSTDDAVQAIRAVTTPQSHPDIHPMAGQDYREYYISRSVDELIADSERQHRATWPAVEELVRVHAMWTSPAVIEGWALRPEWVAELDVPNVASVWLVAEERTLEARIRKAEFHRGASDEEAMIRNFLARTIWYNDRIREAASRLAMPIIAPPPHADVERVAEEALSLIQGS